MEGHRRRDLQDQPLDTPGYADFAGDVDAALSVADLAVIVVSAVDGVEVGTESAWGRCVAAGIPRMVFVNKEDKQRADFHRTSGPAARLFGSGFVPLELPLGEEEALHGIADVLTDEGFEYEPDGQHHTEPLPADVADEEHRLHDELVEEIVSGDDEQLERYLSGDVPTAAELERTLAHELLAELEFPVLCGSALTGVGVDRLADFICELGPSPADRPTTRRRRQRRRQRHGRCRRRPVRQAAGLRLQDGGRPVRRPGVAVQGPVGHGRRRRAPRQLVTAAPRSACTACSTSAARTTSPPTGSSPATSGPSPSCPTPTPARRWRRRTRRCASPPPEPPPAVFGLALKPLTQADDDKLSAALQRLITEDPGLVVDRNEETGQTVLRGCGDTHVAVALERLARKFGVNVETEDVRVPYRETITGTAEAEGKVKKQSGGHGQYAVANLRVKPKGRGDGSEFKNSIVGGTIPQAVHPGGAAGRRGDDGHRRRPRLPRRRRAGRVLRRQVPLRRLLRHGVPLGGRTGAARRRWPRPARRCSSRSRCSRSACPRATRAT